FFFFFQAEDGIRDFHVTGVQTCALPILVIGPEVPLVAGAADAVRKEGIACFGPSASAARIEGSKAFAKEVMTAAGVPTARSEVVDNPAHLDAALSRFGPTWVVKDDGLAAGTRVVVTRQVEHARQHALMLPAQDFKRVGDGDSGPNTGGMGAYAPLAWAPAELVDDVVERIVQPVVDELADRDAPFSGLLYAGLALTSDGPQVIEFNCRFGDPETQVVLALLRTPLAGLLHATATGTLADQPPLEWSDGAAVTVVLAADGYPGKPRTGDVITGGEAQGVLHAGTRRRDDGAVVSSGGRVLSVVGTGPDLDAARADAYERVASVS